MIFLAVFLAVMGLFTRFRRGSKSSSSATILAASLLIASGHSCSVISHALSGRQMVNIKPTTKPMKKKWLRFNCFRRRNCFIFGISHTERTSNTLIIYLNLNWNAIKWHEANHLIFVIVFIKFTRTNHSTWMINWWANGIVFGGWREWLAVAD